MKKKRSNIYLILVCYILFSVISCSKDYKIALENSIKRYKSGNVESVKDIEDNFINVISKRKLNAETLSFGNTFFSQNNDEIKIIFPINRSVKIPENKKISICNINNKYIVIGSNSTFFIFKLSGEFIKKININEERGTIKSIAFSDNRIIYFISKKIKYYDIESDENGWLTDYLFKVPYEKFYNVKLIITGNNLVVITGIAGSYNLNIVDLINRNLKIKNLKISSSKIFADGNIIYYITGKSGNWKMVKYEINSASKKEVTKFNKITDIEISFDGYILEADNKIWAIDFNGWKKRIPFNYNLKGVIDRDFIFKYKNNIYIVKWEKFHNMLDRFSVLFPDLFEEKKE